METKGTTFPDGLRPSEAGKIRCAGIHFEAIAAAPGEPRFVQARRVEDILAAVS